MEYVVTVNVSTVLTVLLAVLTGAGGWWFGASESRKIAKRVGYFFTDWSGSEARDGVAAVPGVMARLKTHDDGVAELRKAVALITAELQTNGGSSVKDQTKANTAAVLGMRADLSEVRGAVGALQAAIVTASVFATPPNAAPEPAGSGPTNHGGTSQ